jgi:hypothetical protein
MWGSPSGLHSPGSMPLTIPLRSPALALSSESRPCSWGVDVISAA